MPNFSLLEGRGHHAQGQRQLRLGTRRAFYRISYSYKGKYLFETSGRYDGNSKFPSNQRWGFFPSGSAGWRISEERLSLRNAEWLDNLKLRVSVGSAGNGLISDTYAYLSTMSISQSSLLNNGSVFNYTAAPSPIPDGLTWGDGYDLRSRVDFEAFNGRLNFSADIYRKKTTDMYVVGEELPAVYGNSAPKGNYADMHTDGWEASISWRNTHTVGGKPLSYNIKVSVWDNTSKITRYTSKTGTLPTNYKVNYYEGMTLGEIWGYRCDGLFQSDEEAQTYANYSKFTNRSAKWSAGDPRYLDLNGDGYVNNGNNTIYDHGDLEKIGNTTPRYCYSIQGGIRWNGIGLSMMWQGVGKRDWYPAKESGYFWGQYGRPYSMALPWHDRPLVARKPRRLLAEAGGLRGLRLGHDPLAAQHALPAGRFVHPAEEPHDRLQLPQRADRQDRSPGAEDLLLGRKPADLLAAEEARQELRPGGHLRRRRRLRNRQVRHGQLRRRRRLSRDEVLHDRPDLNILNPHDL